MEIDGTVNIEIDQYADVSIEIDTEQLAEELAINHNFVDDVVLHNYVDERMDDYELTIQVADLDNKVDDLHELIRELSPDNNYVRINDLREVIDAQIDMRLTRILNDVMKGIEEYRKGN
jgi:hypothetical protein